MSSAGKPVKFINLTHWQRTHWIVCEQTKGLTHADSLLQLPFRSNCPNWVLGHMLVYRDRILELLGETPVLSEEESSPYQRGAEPLTDEGKAVELQRLLGALEQSQKRIVAAYAAVSAETLAAVVEEDDGRTLADRIDLLD